MIEELLLRLTGFFQRKRYAFLLVLTAFTLLMLWGISRLKISESIFSTLPKGKMFEEFNAVISNKNISNQIVFSLGSPPDEDPENTREAAGRFADSLAIVCRGYLAPVVAERPDMQQELYTYVFSHFPELIDPGYYSFLIRKIHPDTIRLSVQSAYKRLQTPEGAFLKEFVLNDPLYLTSAYFSRLGSLHNTEGLSIEDGLVFTADRSAVLITSGTLFDAGNSAKSAELYGKLEDFRAQWNRSHPERQFNYFGTFAIAAQNALQIKQDTQLTLSISLGLILVILLVYYRKLLTPLLILLPALYGGLFAMGMIGFIKPGISGISLATGAILLGIALDYSIHFFTHLRHVRSIPETLKDICKPLITGSLTTILAYSALLFANSTVLRDFGLFAALSLSGALGFTLCILPALLQMTGFHYAGAPEKAPLIRLPAVSGRFRIYLLIAIVLATAGFYAASDGVRFDDNPESLSMHSDNLKAEENRLTGIDPEHDRKIYLFATAPTLEEAAGINHALFVRARALQESGRIRSITSTGDFLIPDSLRQLRRQEWIRFWKTESRLENTLRELDGAAAKTGFSPAAFDRFRQWLRTADTASSATLPDDLGLRHLMDEKDGEVTLITTVVADRQALPQVKESLRNVAGIQLFDRAEMGESLLTMVRADFNYILFVSASIVFVALLLLYGRIELAILSFLPMAISWIWILGFCALADIRFNFVNVVIATFIFGLGDDFSIFMTDGLLHRYKFGKDNLGSYRSAISLSGITTIIGTGVLFFAEHPALRSIAMVSVPGILFIVFISLVFQPVLFDIFVQKRVDKGKTPVTMLTFVMSLIDFAWFLTGCLVIFVLFLVILLLPLPARRKKKWINRLMSVFAASVIYSGPHIRKRLFGKEHLNTGSPAILIANHSSFLDIMLMMMIHPNAVLMVKKWVYESVLFGWAIRYANYVFMEKGSEANARQLTALTAQGYSMVVFPEGTRSEDGKINRFHKGAFYLSERLKLDIQPVLIHGAGEVSPKNEFLVKPGALHVKILPVIAWTDRSWGNTFQERTKSIAAYFKQQYGRFKDEMETPAYLKRRVFYNYVFKGPVLEWYFRFKWDLEKENYAAYDRLIGTRRHITDIGCGYGFLAFYLHYRDENRVILASDYDEEKINIAANAYDKTSNLQFVHADARQLTPGKTDVVFLNDVLHYLPAEDQENLLQRCADALRPGGLIFVRDGITDLGDAHRKTRLTERLSTGIFGFNKKANDLHFFPGSFIRTFASKNNLSCEMERHSDHTSNVLFILRKPGDTPPPQS